MYTYVGKKWAGSTSSAGPFSRWCRCWTSSLGLGRWWIPETWMIPQQTQCWSVVMGCRVGWLFPKSSVIPILLILFSSRLSLVTVLQEADDRCFICNFWKFNRPIFWGPVVGVEQWYSTSSTGAPRAFSSSRWSKIDSHWTFCNVNVKKMTVHKKASQFRLFRKKIVPGEYHPTVFKSYKRPLVHPVCDWIGL